MWIKQKGPDHLNLLLIPNLKNAGQTRMNSRSHEIRDLKIAGGHALFSIRVNFYNRKLITKAKRKHFSPCVISPLSRAKNK